MPNPELLELFVSTGTELLVGRTGNCRQMGIVFAH
jgi:hypothetical protein